MFCIVVISAAVKCCCKIKQRKRFDVKFLSFFFFFKDLASKSKYIRQDATVSGRKDGYKNLPSSISSHRKTLE